MQLKSRPRPVYEVSRVGPYSGSTVRRYRRRRWPWIVGAVLLLVAGVLAAGHFAWPGGSLAADPDGLAKLGKPGFGAGKIHVTAETASGVAIPVSVRPGGVIWPERPITPGTFLHVDVAIRRPGWIGWLAGSTQHLTRWVRAPLSGVKQTFLQIPSGTPLKLSFDHPVSAVRLTGTAHPGTQVLPKPARTLALPGLGDAGTIGIATVSRSWERFPDTARVTWFPTGGPPKLLAMPAPGSSLDFRQPLTLQFSEPVKDLFHGKTPWPGFVPGDWKQTDEHTLVFTPKGFGFGVDTQVKLHLPRALEDMASRKTTRLVSWTTPTGSQLRLQQLLSQLGYLPLSWQPATSDAPRTLVSQIHAAATPPKGTFTWRYGNTPDQLKALWSPGRENVVTRGAVMAFESEHDLLTDGDAGRVVWQELIAASLAGTRTKSGGYSYVIVHREQRPQSLVLWHAGSTILTTAANTGIPQAPTVFGTFPVYARFKVTTMKGTNPDGTKYNDPGIPWVSYFNGGDAIHGFTRASFGSPQSLGCVELPAYEAAKVYPYTPIGTLVTVTS
jgi:lipoprotein-anchoring transpeptidase ErfK/SrfK